MFFVIFVIRLNSLFSDRFVKVYRSQITMDRQSLFVFFVIFAIRSGFLIFFLIFSSGEFLEKS